MKFLYSALYHDDGYPFNALTEQQTVVVHAPEELEEADSALVIWGGGDINPAYYNHPVHRTTYASKQRDPQEWALLQRAIERGIPIIGVCRGAQMLCAAAGGFLIQNVHNHGGYHLVHTIDGDVLRVNSIHHQMMAGFEHLEHELVAWRPMERGMDGSITHAGLPYGYRDNQTYVPPINWREPEFVYFPKINGYAIQWHPEAMDIESAATKYILNYIKQKETTRGSFNITSQTEPTL